MLNRGFSIFIITVLLFAAGFGAKAQTYGGGLIDKSIAIVGNDVILLSDIEEEVRMMLASGMTVESNTRCQILENLVSSRLFLTQARLDSLTVTDEQVREQVEARLNDIMNRIGGEKETEEYFKKPLYKIRADWTDVFRDQLLIQQMQQKVYTSIPKMTPAAIKELCAEMPAEDLPVIPTQYKLRQIVLYPDKESAAMVVKEKLLDLRERVLAGEKFSSLARLYSQDPGSATRGGELGMRSKTVYWPQFSDAAMSLKVGQVSQIVETPDGYHIIQMIEKKGDMFNARHILIKPSYTASDRNKAFARLDSIKSEILSGNVTFEAAAWFNSEDPKTRTNGGMMVDEYTGSASLEKDRLNPADYAVIKDLKPGDISEPFESLDTEGRGHTIYKIVRLDEEIPSHTATFETDYDALVNMANEKNAHKAIENFVEEKKKTTHIRIDPLFAGCKFVNEEWIEK
ncbi:MAG: peptidylprolyl isomerase [Bacteroidales bacterium]|nr:peptidylprolyl isomerase [Bacteroidales bacterium]